MALNTITQVIIEIYRRLGPHSPRDMRWYMSRATAQSLKPELASYIALPGIPVTIFGIAVKIDDLLPYGIVQVQDIVTGAVIGGHAPSGIIESSLPWRARVLHWARKLRNR